MSAVDKVNNMTGADKLVDYASSKIAKGMVSKDVAKNVDDQTSGMDALKSAGKVGLSIASVAGTGALAKGAVGMAAKVAAKKVAAKAAAKPALSGSQIVLKGAAKRFPDATRLGTKAVSSAPKAAEPVVSKAKGGMDALKKMKEANFSKEAAERAAEKNIASKLADRKMKNVVDAGDKANIEWFKHPWKTLASNMPKTKSGKSISLSPTKAYRNLRGKAGDVVQGMKNKSASKAASKSAEKADKIVAKEGELAAARERVASAAKKVDDTMPPEGGTKVEQALVDRAEKKLAQREMDKFDRHVNKVNMTRPGKASPTSKKALRMAEQKAKNKAMATKESRATVPDRQKKFIEEVKRDRDGYTKSERWRREPDDI